MNDIAGVEVGYTQPINNEVSEQSASTGVAEQSVNNDEPLPASNDTSVQSLNTEELVPPIRAEESDD